MNKNMRHDEFAIETKNVTVNKQQLVHRAETSRDQ
jgi:hypothetical protein